MPPDDLRALCQWLGMSFPNLTAAETASSVEVERIRAGLDLRLVPAEADLVVFGSLARGERTDGSDLDWALLFDGPVNAQDQDAVAQIREGLDALVCKRPGPTGVFGGLSFSHELVHRIGGDPDSNRNLTQRILLLLESRALSGGVIRDRVLRALLNRYLRDDTGYLSSERWRARVPRFLLNDVVRYWRTMAVDFSHKLRERNYKGWALRNIKLRCSRKLIFVAGLIACLSCLLSPPPDLASIESADSDAFYQVLIAHLLQFSNTPPLVTVGRFARHWGAQSQARAIFGAYDQFLGLLNGSDRATIEDLKSLEDVAQSQAFHGAKVIATAFQRGLSDLFFKTNPEVTEVAQEYGVF